MSATDNTITMREVLGWIESGRPFQCTCVAYDRKRHTGGDIVEIHEAVMLQRSANRSGTARSLTRTEQLQARLGRNPSHGQWFTRNVQILQQGQPTAIVKKIHPPLILTFNGKEMLI